MTAPTPEKIERPWIPLRSTLLSLCHNEALYDSCKYDYAGEEIEEVCLSIARRAQVAALEELISGREGSAMVDRAKAMIEEIRRKIE